MRVALAVVGLRNLKELQSYIQETKFSVGFCTKQMYRPLTSAAVTGFPYKMNKTMYFCIYPSKQVYSSHLSVPD